MSLPTQSQLSLSLNSFNKSAWELHAHFQFWERALKQGFTFYTKHIWTAASPKLFDIFINNVTFRLLSMDCAGDGTTREVTIQEKYTPQLLYLINYTESERTVFVNIASPTYLTPDIIAECLKKLQVLMPVVTPPVENKLNIRFSTNTNSGARIINRLIDVNPWEDIQDNYPSSVLSKLTPMITTFQPAKGGQLLLWHGKPGTGKTFSLRSLAYAWKNWCDTYYVLDAEVFFSESTYMIDLLLHTTYDDEYDSPKASEKWKLLVLEDAGELLTVDARERTGQGLSRLLNIVDGLIGQGLKILILITTNEALNDLHPAVGRPGRCASEVYFNSFNITEACSWLTKYNIPKKAVSGKDSCTLAELYAIKEGFTGAKGNPKEVHEIGFRK
jgi:hypothetical protein